MSDNLPAKFITVWPWYHDEPAFYILCKVNANSNKLLEKFEPRSSFRFQYRLLIMITFSEIAVYPGFLRDYMDDEQRFVLS